MTKIPGRSPDIISIEDAVETAKLSGMKGAKPLETKDRMTSQFVMHQENCCSDPTSADAKFSSMLMTQGIQPYKRKMKVDEEWKYIDLGWVKDEAKVGYIVIQNFVEPRELKRAALSQNTENPIILPILFVSIRRKAEEDFDILPGHFNVIHSLDPEYIQLKSSGGTVNAWVSVFPR